ncbi:MAG: hypothetical protein PHX51_07145 [Clostridia bacterium]|nr:hypothetical protein [Clostridia bacterium]
MKNTITNIVAVVLLAGGAIQTYIQTLSADAEINILQLILVVGGAIVAWYTGKNKQGKTE